MNHTAYAAAPTHPTVRRRPPSLEPMAPARHKPTATAQWEWVTPAMATQWLNDHNQDNRRLRQGHVDYLAGLLVRGEAKITHQGIGFTKSGRLVDGQHRLKAIEASGVSTWMLVVRGLDEDVFDGIDVGMKRTMEDQTHISRELMDACVWVAEIMEGRASKMTHRISPAQAMKYYRVLGDTLIELNEFCGSKRRKVFTAASATAAAVIRILAYPDQRDATFLGMAALRNQDFASMNTIQQSLSRAVNDGAVNARDREDTACRIWYSLDPSKANLRKVQITEMSSVLQQIKSAMAKIMSERA